MKKILALMGALGLIMASTATVVACGETSEQKNNLKNIAEAISVKTIYVTDKAASDEEILEEFLEVNPALDKNEFEIDRRTLAENHDDKIDADSKIEVLAKLNSTRYFGKSTLYLKVDSRIPIRTKVDQTKFENIEILAEVPTEDEILRIFKETNSELKDANLEVVLGLSSAIIQPEPDDTNYRGKVYITFTVAKTRDLSKVIINKDLGTISYDDYSKNLEAAIGNKIGLSLDNFIVDRESAIARGPSRTRITISARSESNFVGSIELTFNLELTGPKWFNYFIEKIYLGNNFNTNDKTAIMNKIIEVNPRFETVRSEMEQLTEDNILINADGKTVSFVIRGQKDFVLITSGDAFTFYLTNEPQI